MSFSFGAKPAYGTGTATTFGTGSAFNSPAAFNSPTTFASPAAFNSPTAFGAPAATLGAPAGGLASSAPVSSFSAHPFQYIQQCYDPQNLNYRFRVRLRPHPAHPTPFAVDILLQPGRGRRHKVCHAQAGQHLRAPLGPDPQRQPGPAAVPGPRTHAH